MYTSLLAQVTLFMIQFLGIHFYQFISGRFHSHESNKHLFVNHQQLRLPKTSSIGPIVHGQRTVTVNELFTNHFEFVVRNPSVYIFFK